MKKENLDDIILNKVENRDQKKIILAMFTLGVILTIIIILMNSLIVKSTDNDISYYKEQIVHLQPDPMYQHSQQNLTIEVKDSIKINFKTSDNFELSTEVKMSEFVNSLKKSNNKKTIEAFKIMLEMS